MTDGLLFATSIHPGAEHFPQSVEHAQLADEPGLDILTLPRLYHPAGALCSAGDSCSARRSGLVVQFFTPPDRLRPPQSPPAAPQLSGASGR